MGLLLLWELSLLLWELLWERTFFSFDYLNIVIWLILAFSGFLWLSVLFFFWIFGFSVLLWSTCFLWEQDIGFWLYSITLIRSYILTLGRVLAVHMALLLYLYLYLYFCLCLYLCLCLCLYFCLLCLCVFPRLTCEKKNLDLLWLFTPFILNSVWHPTPQQWLFFILISWTWNAIYFLSLASHTLILFGFFVLWPSSNVLDFLVILLLFCPFLSCCTGKAKQSKWKRQDKTKKQTKQNKTKNQTEAPNESKFWKTNKQNNTKQTKHYKQTPNTKHQTPNTKHQIH